MIMPKLSSKDLRITAIETVIPDDIMPGLLLIRIHTDAGVIGHGETAYAPHAVQAMIHDWMARRLLGADALAIESHWRFLYERCSAFGGRGTELRALSAIDVALWDILGQVCGRPVWQLIGGRSRERVTVYNSCGGPSYGRKPGRDQGWPGHGDIGKPGKWEDHWASIHAPGDLAEELVAAGYTAVKMWSFDRAAHRHGGLHLTWSDIEESIAPFLAMRERVGNKLELILDGHGFFQWPAAIRIAEAMRPIKPLWMEDVLRPDSVDTVAEFRKQAGVPIAVSEMLPTIEDYRLVLEKRAADYIMIDPTWVGGITATVRIANLAQAYNIPVLMHDCTGPLTLYSGLHVATALSNVVFQETVRAHIHTLYPDLIDHNVRVENGTVAPPEKAGIGTRLLNELFTRKIYNRRISKMK
jgi:L-alanine-DL-glutamate epimerase-like enolase superfamily enzyme